MEVLIMSLNNANKNYEEWFKEVLKEAKKHLSKIINDGTRISKSSLERIFELTRKELSNEDVETLITLIEVLGELAEELNCIYEDEREEAFEKDFDWLI
jgi:hypothetical protein